MYNAVKKILALHHNIALPGIGNFVVETKPAELDFVSRRITSSQHKIIFNNDELPPEKKFFNFLAGELNMDEVQATDAFTNFTTRLHDALDKNDTIYFKGIGTLSKQDSNVVLFEPEVMPEYFPELVAERIIRKNVAHTVRVGEDEKTSHEMHAALNQPKIIIKEKWWIAATILGAIGIAAIIFYYAIYA
jgi:nucleoid DNA-binding protein